MPPLDDLIDDIFDGTTSVLRGEFEGWVRGSRRYKAFAVQYRAKIRAKLKNAQGDEGIQDVRAELEAAALLLRDAQFTLEYEKYAAAKGRSPDFAVTFKTHTPFNLEVRRIRGIEWDDDAEARAVKLMAVVCDKVGQMPPSSINLLWLTAAGALSQTDLTDATRTLRQLAEGKAEDFFRRRGFDSAADFLKQYRQLSGIVRHQAGENIVWLNSLARHKTPPEIVMAIQRLDTR